jgi:hypothetical protein
MKNEGKNAKHGFKIMTAVITVCAVLCTVFSAMSLVLQYKDHIMLKKYGDFVSCENSTKNAGEKDGFYLVTKEAKAEGESDTAGECGGILWRRAVFGLDSGWRKFTKKLR